MGDGAIERLREVISQPQFCNIGSELPIVDSTS
jgi:hypothetical protein